ncbi:MAG: phosphoribosylglycinamide formyltransferase [Thermoanaerobaculia bacterium]
MLTGRRPLRVAVLTSRRAPGLSELLAERGGLFEIVCVLATEEAFFDARLEAADVPVVPNLIRRFYSWRHVGLSDLVARHSYDRRTVRLLAPYGPDLLLMSSYLYIATEPLLAAYPGRIINVHGSDLARRGPDGRPLYPGLRAVRDAIAAGETETRATSHLVTADLDAGPILRRSRPFPVSPLAARLRAAGADHALNAYAFAHQEWMLATAWGPLLLDAAACFAAGSQRAGAAAEAVS